MTGDRESDRAARIQAAVEAARVERSQTLLRLLRSVLPRRRTARTWRPAVEPALRDCP
jgi:hypothetical protein